MQRSEAKIYKELLAVVTILHCTEITNHKVVHQELT